MAVLMKDVAKKAGVSMATVSQVLSGGRQIVIGEQTRQRVIEVARQLGYRRNANARLLARKSSDTFGLIISEISNPFFPEIVQGFESTAMSHGFDTLLANTEYDPARAQAAVEKMIDNKVRGVAIATSKFEPALIAQMRAQQIPVVVVSNADLPGATARIEIDFAKGLGEAVDHLIDLGHREVAAITGPATVPSAQRYADVLTTIASSKRIELISVLECNYHMEGGIAAIRGLLTKPGLPTGILCGNDLIALGAISVLDQVGIRVPEDISVIGFDDIVFARLASPPLTTVAVPRAKLGRLAFESLFNSPRARKTQVSRYSLDTSLVIRQSTAKSPARIEKPKRSK